MSDFGLARMTDVSRLTLSGTILGSPDYMAPEQARGELAVPGSDVFAAAAITEALAGKSQSPSDNSDGPNYATASCMTYRMTSHASGDAAGCVPPTFVIDQVSATPNGLLQVTFNKLADGTFPVPKDLVFGAVRAYVGGVEAVPFNCVAAATQPHADQRRVDCTPASQKPLRPYSISSADDELGIASLTLVHESCGSAITYVRETYMGSCGEPLDGARAVDGILFPVLWRGN